MHPVYSVHHVKQNRRLLAVDELIGTAMNPYGLFHILVGGIAEIDIYGCDFPCDDVFAQALDFGEVIGMDFFIVTHDIGSRQRTK